MEGFIQDVYCAVVWIDVKGQTIEFVIYHRNPSKFSPKLKCEVRSMWSAAKVCQCFHTKLPSIRNNCKAASDSYVLPSLWSWWSDANLTLWRSAIKNLFGLTFLILILTLNPPSAIAIRCQQLQGKWHENTGFTYTDADVLETYLFTIYMHYTTPTQQMYQGFILKIL